MNKNLITIALIIIILVLLFTQLKSCSSNNKTKQQYENTIVALHDSLHKIINKKGDTVYVQKAAEMTPKDIMNSALYKTLDKQTQDYIKQLADTKGLLASASVTISTQGNIIKQQQYDASTKVSDSTIIFIKGDSVIFPYKTKNLTAKVKLTLKDSLDWKFDYKYQAAITTTWTREKDKSISIEYKLDDPNASMINGKAFYIPAPTKTKFQQYMNYVIPCATFIGGVYLGEKYLK